jgi:hypothetical protein
MPSAAIMLRIRSKRGGTEPAFPRRRLVHNFTSQFYTVVSILAGGRRR